MLTKRPIFVLAGNGSYLNRGCEAIVRGTVRILKNAFDNPLIINCNFDFTRTPYIPVDKEQGLMHKPIIMRRWSSKWIAKQFFERVSTRMDEAFTYRSIKDDIVASTAVLSIGGDNYTLDYGMPNDVLALDNYVTRLKRPLIIWGASVGPFDKRPKLTNRIHDHLRSKVSAFFVREELSYEYLLQNGISENVILMGDPAFVMEAESISEDKMGFSLPRDALGVNLSPLMAKWVTHGNVKAWMLRSIEIVRNMRRNFDMPIVLIPHDTRPHTNDYKFMREVLENLGADRSGIFLLPEDLTAAETKWVISRMKCMVAARTHATIAAFSSYVPTVSLGYSIKSKGLNKQIFGHTDFLISGSDIDKDNVASMIRNVLNSNDDIREHLRNKLPDIQKKALDAGLALREILEEL